MSDDRKNNHEARVAAVDALAEDEEFGIPPPLPFPREVLDGSPQEDFLDPPNNGPPEPSAPLDVPLRQEFVVRGQEALAALRAASPDAGADEQILHRLVADETAIAAALLDAQAQLVGRIRLLLDQPKHLVALSRVMKDVVHVSNSVGRRIEGALGVAANLRAQRRFLANHAKKRAADGF